MNKGFTIKMNNVNLKKLKSAQIKALTLTGEKMLGEKIDQQEIPLQEGTLQNIATEVDMSKIDDGTLSIRHDTPYAARLYYNPQYNFDQTFNTNAKGEWWEDYISGKNKSKPQQIFSHYYKQISGGVVK